MFGIVRGDVFVFGMGDQGSTNLRSLASIISNLNPVIARNIDVIVPEAIVFFLLSSFGESGRGRAALRLGWPDEESCNRLSQISGSELEVAREAGELV